MHLNSTFHSSVLHTKPNRNVVEESNISSKSSRKTDCPSTMAAEWTVCSVFPCVNKEESGRKLEATEYAA